MVSKQNVTKEEINELSQALNAAAESPGSDTEQVRQYDFAHPDKLSKLNLRALQLMFSSLEHPWAATLSAALRSEVTVQVNPIEQSSFGVHAEAFPAACVIGSVTMEPLPGLSIIDLPTTLALSIVNRLTGGKGEGPAEPREMTQIELSIVKRLLNRLCADLSSAWSPVKQVQFSVSELHQSPADVGVDVEELVIVAGTIWNVDSTEHHVNIALPVSSLDPVLDVLDPQTWLRRDAGRGTISAEAVAELLESVNIEVAVEAGHARVSMQDLVNMGVGDVIRLDRSVNDPLDVKIGGRVSFSGRPGLVGRRLSVQIKDRVGGVDESAAGKANPATESEIIQE